MFLQKLTRSILLGLTLSFGGNVADASPGLEPPWGSAETLRPCAEEADLYQCTYDRLVASVRSFKSVSDLVARVKDRDVPNYDGGDVAEIKQALSLDDEQFFNEMINQMTFERIHFIPSQYRLTDASLRNANNAATFLRASLPPAREYCALEGEDPELRPQCTFIMSVTVTEVDQHMDEIHTAKQELDELFDEIFSTLDISIEDFR